MQVERPPRRRLSVEAEKMTLRLQKIISSEISSKTPSHIVWDANLQVGKKRSLGMLRKPIFSWPGNLNLNGPERQFERQPRRRLSVKAEKRF